MQIHKQFSIYLINKPGVLAQVTAALARGKANVIALAVMDTGEHGTLRVVCSNSNEAREVLQKKYDKFTESDVLVVELDNKPGAFAAVCRRLSASKINITYAYCTGGAPGGRTSAVFKIEDIKKAQKVLASPRAQKRKQDPRTVKKPPTKMGRTGRRG